jgi:hypothetical protein
MPYFKILTFLMILLLSGCSSDNGYLKILDEQGYSTIIHEEPLENGVVVFYIPNTMNRTADEEYTSLGASFMKKTFFGWKETLDRGGHSLSGVPELSSQYLPKSDEKSPFPMLYGTINNPKVQDIKIINVQSNTSIQAKIVSDKEQRIWYAFVKQSNKDGEFEIQSLSQDNEIIASIINNDLLPSNSSSGNSKE